MSNRPLPPFNFKKITQPTEVLHTIKQATQELSEIEKFSNLELFGIRRFNGELNKEKLKQLINSRYTEMKRKYTNNIESSTNLNSLKRLKSRILFILNVPNQKAFGNKLNAKKAEIERTLVPRKNLPPLKTPPQMNKNQFLNLIKNTSKYANLHLLYLRANKHGNKTNLQAAIRQRIEEMVKFQRSRAESYVNLRSLQNLRKEINTSLNTQSQNYKQIRNMLNQKIADIRRHQNIAMGAYFKRQNPLIANFSGNVPHGKKYPH